MATPKTIITAAESPSMPGRFQVTKAAGRKVFDCSMSGADAAAAQAVMYAITCGTSYVIIGAEKVMRHIPAEIRSKLEFEGATR